MPSCKYIVTSVILSLFAVSEAAATELRQPRVVIRDYGDDYRYRPPERPAPSQPGTLILNNYIPRQQVPQNTAIQQVYRPESAPAPAPVVQAPPPVVQAPPPVAQAPLPAGDWVPCEDNPNDLCEYEIIEEESVIREQSSGNQYGQGGGGYGAGYGGMMQEQVSVYSEYVDPYSGQPYGSSYGGAYGGGYGGSYGNSYGSAYGQPAVPTYGAGYGQPVVPAYGVPGAY